MIARCGRPGRGRSVDGDIGAPSRQTSSVAPPRRGLPIGSSAWTPASRGTGDDPRSVDVLAVDRAIDVAGVAGPPPRRLDGQHVGTPRRRAPRDRRRRRCRSPIDGPPRPIDGVASIATVEPRSPVRAASAICARRERRLHHRSAAPQRGPAPSVRPSRDWSRRPRSAAGKSCLLRRRPARGTYRSPIATFMTVPMEPLSGPVDEIRVDG